MAIEIERKYLVVNDNWRQNAVGKKYRQGYLNETPGRTIRVRITEDASFITIKGKSAEQDQNNSLGKLEFEYVIPESDAQEILDKFSISQIVSKMRYRVEHEGFTWEIDVFDGENLGLIIAEIELETENQEYPLPSWIGKEVTADKRYYNAYLSQHPYSEWKNNLEF